MLYRKQFLFQLLSNIRIGEQSFVSISQTNQIIRTIKRIIWQMSKDDTCILYGSMSGLKRPRKIDEILFFVEKLSKCYWPGLFLAGLNLNLKWKDISGIHSIHSQPWILFTAYLLMVVDHRDGYYFRSIFCFCKFQYFFLCETCVGAWIYIYIYVYVFVYVCMCIFFNILKRMTISPYQSFINRKAMNWLN